ncbi:MAG TPA: nucleoside-diphosphate sugar epimerase/dehydratase [Candidatus Paceibacterota bacterium]
MDKRNPLSAIFQRTQKTRFAFFLIADILSIGAALLLAFLIRFEGEIPEQYLGGGFQAALALVFFATIPVFLFFRLYLFTWAYVSIGDLLLLARALFISALLTGTIFFILREEPFFVGFPRSVFLLTYLLLFMFCGGLRFSKRVYLQWIVASKNREQKERTLIVGARDEGEELLRSILQSQKSKYLPVGFVDANSSRVGATIHGVRVLGTIDDMVRIAQEHEVQTVIIALPARNSKEIRMAVELGRKAGLQNIQIVPPLAELIGGQISIRELRQVQVEDLLGREQVSLDQEAIKKFVAGKKVLVTGAAGSIGAELSRQIARFSPSSVILLDQDETGMFWISRELHERFPQIERHAIVADIRDEQKVRSILALYKPEIIFHAAAYKHVPLMEAQADEAVKNNVFGTFTVASLAIECGVEKFVFISTDKAVNPTSTIGATKRVGEMICQMLNAKNHTKFVSVRFGNVLDSRGSVIPIFREQIKKGGPVTVTHPDMQRYFMSTPEACLLVLEAGAIGQGGEVFVLDMGSPIKIVDLAKEMIRLSGYEPDRDIPIVFTGERPGEKFFEDMLTAEEGTQATKNQKIFMAKLSPVAENAVREGLDLLQKAVPAGNREEIVRALQSLIPNYTPFSPSQREP